MNILIPLSLILFFGVSLYRREWGIYLIILLLPSYQIRFQVFGVPATFLEGMILLLAVSALIQILLSLRGSPRSNPNEIAALAGFRTVARNDKLTTFFIILFLIAAAISVFTAPDMTRAAGIFKAYFLEAVLVYFLIRLIINSREKLEKLFKVFSVMVLYLSVYGLYQFVTLHNLPHSWWAVDIASRRIVSVLNHPNALALILGPILAMLIIRQPARLASDLPATASKALRAGSVAGGQKTKLAWAAIITGLIAFYLTFSRAGWLALVVTIIIFGFLAKFHNPLCPPYLKGEVKPQTPPLKLGGGCLPAALSLARRAGVGLLLSLSVIIITIFAIPFSRGKLLELTNANDPSKQNRYVLWNAAADLIKKHPVTGVGLMGFREHFQNYPVGPDQVVQNYPHNFFLNFWLETGLLGLASMIGLLAIFFGKVYKILTSPSPPREEGTNPASPPRTGVPQNSTRFWGGREGEIERGSRRNYALAAAAGMAVIVLHSMVDVSYFKNDLSVLFWLIYSLPFLPALKPQILA